MKNTIKQLHNFLNKSLVAKLVVYALALVAPIVNGLLYIEALGFDLYNISIWTLNPYYFNWVGFYSCVLLIWAYCKKASVLVSIVVMLNLFPAGFWCLFALIGGLPGVLMVLATFTIPAPIILLMDNLVLKRVFIFVGVILLVGILILGFRAFWRMIIEGEEQVLKDAEKRWQKQ